MTTDHYHLSDWALSVHERNVRHGPHLYATHMASATAAGGMSGNPALLLRRALDVQDDRSIKIELQEFHGGGSVILPDGAGDFPGLRTKLNPARDTHDGKPASTSLMPRSTRRGAVPFAPGRAPDRDGRRRNGVRGSYPEYEPVRRA